MVAFNLVLPLAGVLLASAVEGADVAVYGQCGGSGYSGSTTCVSGAVCQSQNAFYYQCVQATGTAAVATSGVATSARVTSAASTATASSVTSSATKYLMIFGDSYSSDGFWAGSTTPSSDLPLGVASPGTTTSGGLNWVGQTATKLNSSLVLAFDFAEYGATTDNSLVNGATHDLISQVNEFETYTAHNASNIPWASDNTMAVVWIGINDVGNSYWDGFVTPFDKVLDQYFGGLQKLYDAGIRYFTLFTVPPFDQAPVFAQQTTQNMNYVRGNITTYNDDLVTRMAAFKAANSGVTGTVFNTSASFWTALDNPSAYGVTDTTCTNSDGTTCLWYDTYHPGQAIQKLVAQNFMKALTGVFF
ncbi:hypothetical protein ACMFMG_004729 [Clarireedia jacksonii]